MKDVIDRVLSEYSNRHKIACGRKPNAKSLSREKRSIVEILKKSPEQVCYKISEGGKLAYFYYFKKEFFPPLGKEIYVFPLLFSSGKSNEQKELRSQLDKHIVKLDSEAMVRVFETDLGFQKYFEKKSLKTIHLTLGRVQNGLRRLSEREIPKLKTVKMKKTDIEHAVKVELKAHRDNKSSTMHDAFTRKGASSMCRKFLEGLVRQKSAFSVFDGQTNIGHFGFFADPKTGEAFVATVAIHPNHQGKGFGLALYLGMLSELKKREIKIYEGFTSTESVLAMLEKLERKTFLRGYIVDPKKWGG